MRIGVIAPLEMRVPPVAYGGTELVVSLLVEGLVKQGHDVTLFASGDSITKAKLEAIFPHFLRGTDRDKPVLNMLNTVACLEQADKFDIIHNHTPYEGFLLSRLVKTPMLTTLHGAVGGDYRLGFMHYNGWYNTISNSAKKLLPQKDNYAGVVYNAIDVSSYPFNPRKRGDHLLFLSRISAEKGPHIAIEVAKRLGRRLLIAGNIDAPDEEFFCTQVQPYVDGDQVRFLGEADHCHKRKLMAEACCLVAPITWDEPFGLFLVEAMACGTPVVVFNRGSAAEVVKDGETGYVVNTVEEMAEAVEKIDQIDKKRCREHVECHFDVPRMVSDYVAAYERIICGAGKPCAMPISVRQRLVGAVSGI